MPKIKRLERFCLEDIDSPVLVATVRKFSFRTIYSEEIFILGKDTGTGMLSKYKGLNLSSLCFDPQFKREFIGFLNDRENELVRLHLENEGVDIKIRPSSEYKSILDTEVRKNEVGRFTNYLNGLT